MRYGLQTAQLSYFQFDPIPWVICDDLDRQSRCPGQRSPIDFTKIPVCLSLEKLRNLGFLEGNFSQLGQYHIPTAGHRGKYAAISGVLSPMTLSEMQLQYDPQTGRVSLWEIPFPRVKE